MIERILNLNYIALINSVGLQPDGIIAAYIGLQPKPIPMQLKPDHQTPYSKQTEAFPIYCTFNFNMSSKRQPVIKLEEGCRKPEVLLPTQRPAAFCRKQSYHLKDDSV